MHRVFELVLISAFVIIFVFCKMRSEFPHAVTLTTFSLCLDHFAAVFCVFLFFCTVNHTDSTIVLVWLPTV